MKSVSLVVIMVLIIAGSLASPEGAEAAFGVRVSGSYSYITYGDYNDFADYANSTVLPAIGVTGAKFDNMNWVPEFKGEFFFPVIPTFESGVGAGIIMGSADFSFSFLGDGVGYEHKVRSYPFTYTAYFTIPAPMTGFKPIVYGGIGAYYSKITFTTSVTGLGEDYSDEAELTDWGFGLHGGAGLEISIAPTVSIDISIFGRWADMKGFEGTYTRTDGENYDVYLASDQVWEDLISEEALYYGQWTTDDKSLEEGSVNLSGYGFTLGLKIGF